MVNRMRATSGHRNNRRSHHKIDKPTLSKDEKGVIHMSHRASPTTGEYRGRQVVDVLKKTIKKQAKKAPSKTEGK
jgi:ribosomal protein L32